MLVLYIILWIVSLLIVVGGVLVVKRNASLQVLELRKRLRTRGTQLDTRETALRSQQEVLEREQREIAHFQQQKVQYANLKNENDMLKQDLFNLHVKTRKLELDDVETRNRQEEIRKLADEIAGKYLDENVSWISKSITPTNFATSKKRLLKVIDLCRRIGFEVSRDRENELVQALQAEFEKVVRREYERQEQARIKERIREEQRLEREIQREITRLDREREAVKAALEKALAEAEDAHSTEIERLRERLREAEERSARAKSRAEMTRSGYVYVISNIGSFGGDVFKVGMTRRLEPLDRVRELGDASVPFPFDVHMMVSSEDAPTLETALHNELQSYRMNKVNNRKEFFRVPLDTIRQSVERHHGEVEYVADAEALQYRESLETSNDDFTFISKTMDALTKDDETVVE